jgi:hypothetical protein
VTLAIPVSYDLADTPCTVAECLEHADRMGRATVHVNPKMGAPPDFEVITLGLPLCTNHAHLLSMGCTLDDFNSGL